MKIFLVLLFSSLILGEEESVIKRGDIIYEEAFTEELSNSWKKSSKGDWRVNEGRLVGKEPDGNNHAVHLSFIPEIEGDVIIELDMLIRTPAAQAGIMFHPGKASHL